MSFLPKDYRDPSSGSNYMKFEDGANKFRILTEPLMGYEYWTEDGDKRKPIRVKTFQEVPQEFKAPADNKDKAKFFWALVVWNYNAEKQQVLQIGQAGIRGTLEDLDKDPDWGDPREYDLVVNKTGKGLETNYSVIQKPKTKFDKKGKELPKVNLEALFTGEDPFNSIEINFDKIAADLDGELPSDTGSSGSAS